MLIIQGALKSKWTDFVNLVVDMYGAKKSSVIRSEPVFIPLEYVGRLSLPNSSWVYISSIYQVKQLVSIYNSNRIFVAASSQEIVTKLAEFGIESKFIQFCKPSEKLKEIFTEEIKPVVSTAKPRERKEIIYSVNASYQVEHIVGLHAQVPGKIIIPEGQFDKLENNALSHRPALSDLTSVSYPVGVKDSIRGKFLISTGIYKQIESGLFSEALYVCHGISDKEDYHSRAAKAGFRFYASSGPRFTDLYKKYGVSDEQILKCGYLRLDTPFEEIEPFDVLFAPTHHADTILPYIDELIKYCSENKLILKIRLHPLTETSTYGKIRKRIERYLVPGSVSTWSLLHAAKKVVTDVSSISYESVLLDKPVVLLDGKTYWTKLADKFSSNFGPIVTYDNPKGLSAAMEADFTRKISKDEVFYSTQSPSKICMDLVLEYLNASS